MPQMARYSRITWGLFVQTLKYVCIEVKIDSQELDILSTQFSAMIQEVWKAIPQGNVLSWDQQPYLEELLSIQIELLTQSKKDD
jgi:hypothetical protein